ncbi:MAG TPA: hypothetical protein DCW53_05105 [Rikenellaceae bacterium]|nr:hypothetical protein [Rikenellaceae bacterium]
MANEAGNIKKRDRIGVTLYVVYLLLLIGAVAIVSKIIYIQIEKPNPKIVEALTPASIEKSIEPKRGRIFDSQGRLLAISCPEYQFYIDCTVMKAESDTSKQEREWHKKAQALADGLAREFGDKSSSAYYKSLADGRRKGKKYLKLGKRVDHNTYKRLMELPLFNEGRFRGGVIVERENIRRYPYGELARRTIGFVRNNKSQVTNTHIGIEGKFDYILHGTEGVEYLRTTDYGRVLNSDSTVRAAIDGKDIITTLNIDYQDIADKALREQIEGEDALEGACLVLMETKTGAIRAMVNLVRDADSGRFGEIQNYAVGRKAEPGSVFKTVTLMSVLNDGYIKSLDETLPAKNGHVEGTSINDAHIPDFARQHHTDRISVLDGFKISSNYVFATLAVKYYGKRDGYDGTDKFLSNIYNYKLGEAFDFDLDGLQTPTIPSPKTRYWTNTDLGSIAFGYSTEETPLHILTFYNAIANKGKMMKPYLVNGPGILNSAVCSRAVADTLTRALKAVTEEGTARRLKGAKCSVAGKTGTSFGTYANGKYVDEHGRRKYQGTFVGFFPAENPQYSIISVVYSKPTNKSFQGGGIPAKAIRTVIDRIYDIDPFFQEDINKKGK